MLSDSHSRTTPFPFFCLLRALFGEGEEILMFPFVIYGDSGPSREHSNDY